MELHEVVFRLVGPVDPVGETQEDTKRLANIKVLTELTSELLHRISMVSLLNSGRQEFSMKIIGQHAQKFLMEVKSDD